MNAIIFVFALCLTLATAKPTHPLLHLLDGDEVPDDVKKCVEAHQAEITECAQELIAVVMQHLQELMEHEKDPENLKDSTKKDICCTELTTEDCMLSVVKSTPGCVDALKREFDKADKKESYVKTCGTKYARGGPGDRKSVV